MNTVCVTSRLGKPRSDPRRLRYVRNFQIVRPDAYKLLTESFMDQLDSCVDESARRILLSQGRPRNTKGE